MNAESGDDQACRKAVARWLTAKPLWSRALAALRTCDLPVYLVGGSIRDALRGESGVDMDLAVDGSAVDGGAISLGRWLADRLGGAFYPMDREHDVARIILDRDGPSYHIDLAGLRGKTILQDLAARDLTINAMGMALTAPLGPLLDPTGGRDDLARGLVRAAYPDAFADDPVRMLRALRLAGSLDMALDSDSYALIRAHRDMLKRVSAERIRDELFLMLALDTVMPLRHALALGLLERMLPVPEHNSALGGIAWIEALHAGGRWDENGEAHPEKVREAWRQPMVEGRLRGAIVSLAALVAEVPASKREGLGARLRLSGREQAHLKGILAALDDVLWASDREPGPGAAHRYFRRYGEAGVDGAMLAAYRPGATQAHIRVVAYLLWAWFDAYTQIVEPPRLLQGHDLIQEFDLQPGPRIGRLLAVLAEAQAEGRVLSGEQAREYIRRLVALDKVKGNCI